MEVAPTGDAGGAFVQLLGGAPALLVVAHPDEETRVADDGRPAVRARGGGPAGPRAGVETWLEH